MHVGNDGVICAWERDGVIIDPGPESSMDRLLQALEGREPKALLLTHIHLDHAGATGALVERYPDLPVYVHRIGAPHMVDPSRLIASASRLYGDDMERFWGRIVGVPEQNIRSLEGGETVEGLEVLYTPGHAFHHVSYLESGGDAFVGDVAGVRPPGSPLTVMPTPPPEIDLPLWRQSIEALRARSPQRLCLTHFGPLEDAAEGLEAALERLDWAERHSAEGDPESFVAALDSLFAELPAEVADRHRRAAAPDQLWKGLERYHRKRREAESNEPGTV